jgi:hypothetical protein
VIALGRFDYYLGGIVVQRTRYIAVYKELRNTLIKDFDFESFCSMPMSQLQWDELISMGEILLFFLGMACYF